MTVSSLGEFYYRRKANHDAKIGFTTVTVRSLISRWRACSWPEDYKLDTDSHLCENIVGVAVER